MIYNHVYYILLCMQCAISMLNISQKVTIKYLSLSLSLSLLPFPVILTYTVHSSKNIRSHLAVAIVTINYTYLTITMQALLIINHISKFFITVITKVDISNQLIPNTTTNTAK